MRGHVLGSVGDGTHEPSVSAAWNISRSSSAVGSGSALGSASPADACASVTAAMNSSSERPPEPSSSALTNAWRSRSVWLARARETQRCRSCAAMAGATACGHG